MCGTCGDGRLLYLFVLNGESVFFRIITAPLNGNRSMEENHAADAAPFGEKLNRPILLKGSVQHVTCQRLYVHSCHLSLVSVRLTVNALCIC